MPTWLAAFAALGLVLTAFGVVWYKYTQAKATAGAAQGALEEAEAKREAQETQAAVKTAAERQELHDAIVTVNAIPDPQERTKAALDLLAKLRSVR